MCPSNSIRRILHPPWLRFSADPINVISDFKIPVFLCSDQQVTCRFVEGFLLRIRWNAAVKRPAKERSKIASTFSTTGYTSC
jgi:hypothetical protein